MSYVTSEYTYRCQPYVHLNVFCNAMYITLFIMPKFMSMIQRGSKERILLCEAKQDIAGAKRRLAKQIENKILIAGRICGPS